MLLVFDLSPEGTITIYVCHIYNWVGQGLAETSTTSALGRYTQVPSITCASLIKAAQYVAHAWYGHSLGKAILPW